MFGEGRQPAMRGEASGKLRDRPLRHAARAAAGPECQPGPRAEDEKIQAAAHKAQRCGQAP